MHILIAQFVARIGECPRRELRNFPRVSETARSDFESSNDGVGKSSGDRAALPPSIVIPAQVNFDGARRPRFLPRNETHLTGWTYDHGQLDITVTASHPAGLGLLRFVLCKHRSFQGCRCRTRRQRQLFAYPASRCRKDDHGGRNFPKKGVDWSP